MPTRLLFFSDFVCPFCYVAERGVLGRLVETYDVALEWSGFQLHPSTPKGGMDLRALFPQADPAAMAARMQTFARDFGVTMQHPTHIPNTRRALAAAEAARDDGRLHPFRHAVMEAHWNGGEDIEADTTLARAADACGLDPARIVAAADAPEMQARVDTMGAEARRWGVTGIPTYFLLPDGWAPGAPTPAPGQPRPVRVVGCQPWDTVVGAAKQAGATLRAGAAGPG